MFIFLKSLCRKIQGWWPIDPLVGSGPALPNHMLSPRDPFTRGVSSYALPFLETFAHFSVPFHPKIVIPDSQLFKAKQIGIGVTYLRLFTLHMTSCTSFVAALFTARTYRYIGTSIWYLKIRTKNLILAMFLFDSQQEFVKFFTFLAVLLLSKRRKNLDTWMPFWLCNCT